MSASQFMGRSPVPQNMPVVEGASQIDYAANALRPVSVKYELAAGTAAMAGAKADRVRAQAPNVEGLYVSKFVHGEETERLAKEKALGKENI